MKIFLILLFLVQISQAQQFITGEENLPPGVMKLIDYYQLYESHSLYTNGGSEQIKMATDRQVDPLYLPEKRLKFPLPYYLIPQSEADFISAKSLSPQVLEQLQVVKDGQIFYKLFVHPKSESYYQFLKNKSYTYIDANSTEFMATSTTSLRSLVVWQFNNSQARPFIAKVSLNQVSGNENRVIHQTEVYRSVRNQQALDRLPEDYKKINQIEYFPETAGLIPAKGTLNSDQTVGGQIIREIPNEVLNDTHLIISLGTLMSHALGEPLLIQLIRNSGMTPKDFVRNILIRKFGDLYEALAFKQGFNITTHGQNLSLKISKDFSSVESMVFQDFGGIRPNIIAMIRAGNGLQDVYREPHAEKVHRFSKGFLEVHEVNYITQYKEWVFRKIVTDILPKYFPEFKNEETRNKLMWELNHEQKNRLSRLFGIHGIQGLSDKVSNASLKIQSEIQLDMFVDFRTRTPVNFLNTTEGMAWRNLKAKNNERTVFHEPNTVYQAYATIDGIYVVGNDTIVSFYFFNKVEKAVFEFYGPKKIKDFYKHINEGKGIQDLPVQSCRQAVAG